jgi:hypothetical protein
VLRCVGQSGLAAFAFSGRVPSPDSFALFALTFTFRNCLAIWWEIQSYRTVKVPAVFFFFFFGFLKSILWSRQSGHDPKEDLATFGYKLSIKVKIFRHSFYISGYILEPWIKIWRFLKFLIKFGYEKSQKTLDFRTFNFKYSFLAIYSQQINSWMPGSHVMAFLAVRGLSLIFPWEREGYV